MKKILSTLVIGVSLATGRVFADDLPTCFVAPFSGDTTAIQYWQPAMGEGLGEMLTTELGKINKFQMLEINDLGDLKNEINMGADGWVDQSQKVDKGGFAAADFMFTAKVTRFGNKELAHRPWRFCAGRLGQPRPASNRLPTCGLTGGWWTWRRARSSRPARPRRQQKGGGFDVGANIGGSGGNISFGNSEFMDSALGKATEKTLQQIIADVQGTTLPESGRVKQKAGLAAKTSAANDALKHTPGKVLAVASKDTIIVSLGSKLGFKEGDKLELYQTNDVKDDKGNVVFTDEKLVGELTILSVQDDRSRASYSGDLTVQQGWTVKAK